MSSGTQERVGYWAEAGDVFFGRGTTVLARLIRWGEGSGSWTNHMGVVVGSGWLVPPPGVGGPLAGVVEALWKTYDGPWWPEHRDEYEGAGFRVRVFRHVPGPTPTQLDAFVRRARSYDGDTYGWWKLLGFLAKRLTHVDVPALFFVDSRPICSYLAAEVCAAVGWGFGTVPQAVDPAGAEAWCEAHPVGRPGPDGAWAEVFEAGEAS